MNQDFHRVVPQAHACKVNEHDVEKTDAIRVYCTQSSAPACWALQVRSTMRLANGRKGADYIVATASLQREDMLALRDAINVALAE